MIGRLENAKKTYAAEDIFETICKSYDPIQMCEESDQANERISI